MPRNHFKIGFISSAFNKCHDAYAGSCDALIYKKAGNIMPMEQDFV